MDISRSRDGHRQYPFVCKACEHEFYARKGSVFCGKACRGTWLAGKNHPLWKGGVSDSSSYRRIRQGRGRYRAEHILIAEKVLGRPLRSNECVHHINGDKMDNRNSNLLIGTKSYHQQLHQRASHLYMRGIGAECTTTTV